VGALLLTVGKLKPAPYRRRGVTPSTTPKASPKGLFGKSDSGLKAGLIVNAMHTDLESQSRANRHGVPPGHVDDEGGNACCSDGNWYDMDNIGTARASVYSDEDDDDVDEDIFDDCDDDEVREQEVNDLLESSSKEIDDAGAGAGAGAGARLSFQFPSFSMSGTPQQPSNSISSSVSNGPSMRNDGAATESTAIEVSVLKNGNKSI
jgi:hypothetical protein